ncbi:abscisic aldehyde oxidase 3 [Artemisia annua]|uniref:Abscisic aldehyde oxidase 3 n=1 Tax=Artemisia annua TaxID=35608 RepID=A0A2U1MKF1_ARTAN|nr:abscisic aldehyde oxidase 3 [Artemisia annua]
MERFKRGKIREKRRKEREMERRLKAEDAAVGKMSKINRDRDHEISEIVALCTYHDKDMIPHISNQGMAFKYRWSDAKCRHLLWMALTTAHKHRLQSCPKNLNGHLDLVGGGKLVGRRVMRKARCRLYGEVGDFAKGMAEADHQTVEQRVERSSFFEVPLMLYPSQVGDFAKGMAEADHQIHSAEIRLPSQYYFYIETQTALAIPDEDNWMVVYSSIEVPEYAQEQHCGTEVGISMNQVNNYTIQRLLIEYKFNKNYTFLAKWDKQAK